MLVDVQKRARAARNCSAVIIARRHCRADSGYSGQLQSYHWVQYAMVMTRTSVTAAARSNSSSGTLKLRMSSSVSPWTLFMAPLRLMTFPPVETPRQLARPVRTGTDTLLTQLNTWRKIRFALAVATSTGLARAIDACSLPGIPFDLVVRRRGCNLALPGHRERPAECNLKGCPGRGLGSGYQE
jgi:hypothetical protein